MAQIGAEQQRGQRGQEQGGDRQEGQGHVVRSRLSVV